MRRSKSLDRFTGGLIVLGLLAAFPAFADDEFSLPTVIPTAANAPVGAAAQNSPDAPMAVGPERWVRRTMQMREAAMRQNIPSAGSGSFAPQPANVGPAPQSALVPPSPASLAPPPTMAAAPPTPALPATGRFVYQPRIEPALTPAAPPPVAEPITNPSQLPKLTQILPYFDYEPDPKVAREDPCQNLCPRPDGAPCKTPPGGKVPECPKEIPLSTGPYEPRLFPPSSFNWQASNVCYNPLYFEDPGLERYGHALPCGLQPLASIARFTVQAAGLPYQMTIDPPCTAVYPLGYYRPGEYAPKLIYQIPWNTQAALVEAGAVTGVYFLFPHSAW